MKHMKTRIAAVCCAAIAAVSATQAISASAVAYDRSQDYCEDSYNMSYEMRGLSRYMYPSGSTFSQNISCGPMCGKGYVQNTISNKNNGTPLSGSEAWCRYVADNYFATNVYMELPCNKYSSLKLGDQLRISRSGEADRSLFVTSINGSEFYATSLNSSNKVVYGERYIFHNGALIVQNSAGQTVKTYNVNYITRPIKKGDANGDGVFTSADVDWVYNHLYMNQSQCGFNNKRWDLLMKAVFNENGWRIEYSAYYTLGFNLNHMNGTNQINNTGRMTFDGAQYFDYVK